MKHVIKENTSLLDALRVFYPESSRRTHLTWIKWGRILVGNQVQTRANAPLLVGQTLELEKKEHKQLIMGIPILYQDRWLIAIDKPAGLLSVPAEKDSLNAFHMLKVGMKSPSLLPVHRLDQDTSGVLVFARSKLAEEKMNVLFEKHDLDREYHAIVEGRMSQDSGTWESYLREREDYHVVVTTPEMGRKAITHFEVIRKSKKLTFLKLRLETGRKHQIRVQAAEAGFPIVGDKRYGALLNPYKRLCLHARLLSFIHPFTQKRVTFTSTLTHTPRYTKNPLPNVAHPTAR